MPLIDINKARYRRHLNRIIIACIVSLTVSSLAISQILIALFPDESGSHFHWNLLGVILSATAIGAALNMYKSHDYMIEVVYVWRLKQALNKINRKMTKLQAASQTGDVNAMLAIQYSFAGSRLLWQLDDNTIIMDELVVQQAQLDSLAKQYNVSLNADEYDESVLGDY